MIAIWLLLTEKQKYVPSMQFSTSTFQQRVKFEEVRITLQEIKKVSHL